MDESKFGARDHRGYWVPSKTIKYPPVFVIPFKIVKFLKWFFGYPGYLFPWNAIYLAVAAIVWFWLTPAMEDMQNFALSWIGLIFLRNAALAFAFYGAFHLLLYIQRRQGTSFKYNPNWPSNKISSFLFKSQNVDNLIWAFASGIPIWTAFEVVTLWLYANGYVPWANYLDNPVYFVIVMLLVPIWRDVHFYVVHRILHWPPLYKTVHKLHHKNINPGPWSGLAMHPVEHFLYFTTVAIHWIIPSHPIHAIFNLMHAALSPAPGHTGFDKVVLGDETAVDTHCYAHYLHHRYFECNYADGVIPLDKWFGTFHDGSEDALQKMRQRLADRPAGKM
ncbi:MAG: sterol desaturase family protein [Rhizobiaceae bacterium]|nr:sterol desaturase family protein [Rhizobiaceae bacterium]